MMNKLLNLSLIGKVTKMLYHIQVINYPSVVDARKGNGSARMVPDAFHNLLGVMDTLTAMTNLMNTRDCVDTALMMNGPARMAADV